MQDYSSLWLAAWKCKIESSLWTKAGAGPETDWTTQRTVSQELHRDKSTWSLFLWKLSLSKYFPSHQQPEFSSHFVPEGHIIRQQINCARRGECGLSQTFSILLSASTSVFDCIFTLLPASTLQLLLFFPQLFCYSWFFCRQPFFFLWSLSFEPSLAEPHDNRISYSEPYYNRYICSQRYDIWTCSQSNDTSTSCSQSYNCRYQTFTAVGLPVNRLLLEPLILVVSFTSNTPEHEVKAGRVIYAGEYWNLLDAQVICLHPVWVFWPPLTWRDVSTVTLKIKETIEAWQTLMEWCLLLLGFIGPSYKSLKT